MPADSSSDPTTDPPFDPLAYARAELVPVLRAIRLMVEEEQKPDQARYFGGILDGIEAARDGTDLAEPFMALSMSAFVGFAYSSPVAMMLDSLLYSAQQLSEVLSLDDEAVH